MSKKFLPYSPPSCQAALGIAVEELLDAVGVVLRELERTRRLAAEEVRGRSAAPVLAYRPAGPEAWMVAVGARREGERLARGSERPERIVPVRVPAHTEEALKEVHRPKARSVACQAPAPPVVLVVRSVDPESVHAYDRDAVRERPHLEAFARQGIPPHAEPLRPGRLADGDHERVLDELRVVRLQPRRALAEYRLGELADELGGLRHGIPAEFLERLPAWAADGRLLPEAAHDRKAHFAVRHELQRRMACRLKDLDRRQGPVGELRHNRHGQARGGGQSPGKCQSWESRPHRVSPRTSSSHTSCGSCCCRTLGLWRRARLGKCGWRRG